MKRLVFSLVLGVTVAAVAAWPARWAQADETANVDINVQANLDATNCTATPPTISVLGLSIDVSTATINAGSGDSGGDSGDGTPTATPTTGGCAALVTGQGVEVHLASDTPNTNGNLTATTVDQSGDQGGDVSIQAPIQVANTSATPPTIQLLGLSIDLTNANLGGAEDNWQDGNGDATGTPTPTPTPMPVGFSQLTVGQFVEVQLDPSQLPSLMATELQVKDFTNGVTVEVDDSTGTPVDDSSNDVTTEADDTTTVQVPPTAAPSPGTGSTTASRRPRRMRKTVTITATGNGTITLNGLPTGRVRLSVTRTSNGVTTTGHRIVFVRRNRTRTIRVRLRRVK